MPIFADATGLIDWLEEEGGLFDEARLIGVRGRTLLFDAELSATKSHVSGARFSLSSDVATTFSPARDELTAARVRATSRGVELRLTMGREVLTLCAKR
jgi:hypothetical protein